MRTLEKVRAVLAEGGIVETVENTYRPALNGSLRRIEHCGTSVFRYVVLDGPNAGEHGRSELPKARDVVEVDEEKVRYRLAKARGGQHTVELRQVSPARYPQWKVDLFRAGTAER